MLGPAGLSPWLFAAFALAFAIKVPVFPFHTWLPDAHVEAPTAGSVLLAGVLLKMGTYGFLRFAVPFFPDVAMSPFVTKLVVVLAVIGIVYGALVATGAARSQEAGGVLLGQSPGIRDARDLGRHGAQPGRRGHGHDRARLLHRSAVLPAWACSMSGGTRARSRRTVASRGWCRSSSLVFTVVALSSIGLPGLNGFVGEFLVLVGSFRIHPVATGIAATGVIFAAAYMLWALQRVFLNKLDKPENAGIRDLGPRELLVMVPLLAGIVWMGLYPAPVLQRIEPALNLYHRPAARRQRGLRAGPAAQGRPPVVAEAGR